MNKSYNLVVIPFGLGIVSVTNIEFTEEQTEGNKYGIAIIDKKEAPGIVGKKTGESLTDKELFDRNPVILTFPNEEHRDLVLKSIFNRS